MSGLEFCHSVALLYWAVRHSNEASVTPKLLFLKRDSVRKFDNSLLRKLWLRILVLGRGMIHQGTA